MIRLDLAKKGGPCISFGLLSDIFEDGRTKEKKLGGLLNLLVLLLIITNVKNVIVSLEQHGF